ncbi:MAG: RNA methyltransferase [Thermoanaerobaculia bacterium]
MRSAAIVLVRPRLPANLGAVARVAKNFGVLPLRLVEPAAAADEEAARLASGADDVLETLTRHEKLTEAVADCEIVIATSSLRGRGQIRPLQLAELPGYLSRSAPGRIAFVFGPERSGLTEEERSHASTSLRLPTRPEFPTMNLSHAVAVVLAVAAAFPGEDPGAAEKESLAPASEIEATVGHWDRALEAIGFYDTGHRERSLREWRRLIAGRPLSEREVAMLRGVANRVLVSLRRRDPG